MSETSLEIFIIDDEKIVLNCLDDLARARGLIPICFENPDPVREELDRRLVAGELLPAMYVVDMRIPNNLEGSEAFYNYFRDNNLPGKFVFFTGNISRHDAEVQARTGVEIIQKPYFTRLYEIWEGITSFH